jgi:hypothetical protein
MVAVWQTRPRYRDAVTERSMDDPSTWTILHFAQSNSDGVGQGDVPALLRRVADTIEGYGDSQVQDITFHSAVTEGEDHLMMAVYYLAEPRRR